MFNISNSTHRINRYTNRVHEGRDTLIEHSQCNSPLVKFDNVFSNNLQQYIKI